MCGPAPVPSLMLVELVLKLALALIMLPVLLLIVIIQHVLIALTWILEKCITGVQDMQRFVELAAKRINARLKKMNEREAYFQKLEDRVNGELSWLSDPSNCEGSRHMLTKGRCTGVHRSKECDFKLVKRSPQPLNCPEIATRARKQMEVYEDICCGFFKKLMRIFKKILIFIIRAIVAIILGFIMLLLKIVELALLIIRLAVQAVELVVKGLILVINNAFGPSQKKPLGENNIVSIPSYYRWLWNAVLLRVNYLGISLAFSKNALGFACDVDLVLLGWPISFQITFYLDFDRFIESLFEGVKSLFVALFGGGGRDPNKPRAGQRDPRMYKQKKPSPEDLPDDYEIDAIEGMTNSTNVTNPDDLQTPEVKLAARLGMAPKRRTVSVHERALVAHSRSDAHGAVFHAAFTAHHLGHGGRKLASDSLGIETSDEMLWSFDHRGEETLLGEGALGAAVRAEHDEHITSVSLAASLASRSSPMRHRAALLVHGVFANSTENDEDVRSEHWRAFLNCPLQGDEHDEINVDGHMARSALGAAQNHEELSSLTRDLHIHALASDDAVVKACAPAAMHWSPLDTMVDALCGRVTDAVSTSPESAAKSLDKLSKACKSRVPGAKKSTITNMAASGRHTTVAHAIAASLALRGGAAELASAIHAARTADDGLELAVASALRSALAEPCEGAAISAALSCGGDDQSPIDAATTARRLRCAKSLNTVSSPRCADKQHLTRCRAAIVDALPCSRTCATAMVAMTTPCGGFIPRMEQGFSFEKGVHGSTPACFTALQSAQDLCGDTARSASDGDAKSGEVNSKSDNSACERLLEATPESLHTEVTAAHAANKHQWLSWSEQHARGVVPKSVACGLGGATHIDLRGNNFLGTVPDCVWDASHGNSQIYLSRNALTGTVGRLGSHVRHVHLNDNYLHGDLGPAVAHVDGLRMLDVSGNAKLTGSLGFLRGKHLLRHLDVHGNAFTDGPEEPIAGVLAGLPHLHSYDISRNDFGWNGTTVERFGEDRIQSASFQSGAKRRLAGGVAVAEKDTPSDDGSPATRAYPSDVTLGAGAAAPTQVHLVVHLAYPVAHFCPYCDGSVLEHNCGAISECHSRPDLGQFLTDDYVGKEHGEALRKIAAGRPDVAAWAEKADSLDALQCTLKSLAAAGSRRGGLGAAAAAADEIKVELLRTYPYHGDTIASYTLHFPSAATASEGAAALAALKGHVGHELAPAAGCDAGAHFGELLEVTARVGCHTGFMGARCNYHCATRWERFESRMHTVNDQTSPVSRQRASAAHGHRDEMRKRKRAFDEHPDHGDATDENIHEPPDREHLRQEKPIVNAGSTALATASGRTVSSSSRQLMSSTDTDNEEGKHQQREDDADAWLYGDGLIEYHHHVYIGDNHEVDRHPRSVGTMSCSVGCRGYAHESLHLCKAWVNTGRTKTAHAACKAALRETERTCGVNFQSDCHARGHDSYTPQRLISDENHPCEVCGVYHHLREFGIFTSGVSSTPRMYAKLRDVIRPTARRRSSSFSVRDQGPVHASRLTDRDTDRAASVSHAVIAEATLGLSLDAGSTNGNDDRRRTAAARLNDDDLKTNLHVRATAFASGSVDEAGDKGGEDGDRGELVITSGDAVKMQLPRCYPAMGCSMECGSSINAVMSTCIDWLDQAPNDEAESSTGAPRDLCISALQHSRGMCANTGELNSCYHPTADGFVRILLGPNKDSPDAINLGKDIDLEVVPDLDAADAETRVPSYDVKSNKKFRIRRVLKDAA